MGIKFDVLRDDDDEINLVEFKYNVAGIGLSVEVAEIVSVVNTYELDCAVVEVGIKFDVSHDVDDEIILVEFK